ncbi:MAG: class C beta-lactamase-related serine hydrolase [Candidatus Electrothrix sp. AR4]|nr:class C beta-lactamase-related serine hydrolase [Candidatus Electrothrix sp. AR4]
MLESFFSLSSGQPLFWIQKMPQISLSKFLFLFFFVSAFFLQSCKNKAVEEDYFPPARAKGGWRTNTSREFVESQGLNYDALQELGRYGLFAVKNSCIQGYDDHNHASVLFIKNGWILGEWYLRPESRTFQQYLSSNGKSFAYFLFGMLMKEAKSGRLQINEFSEKSKLYNPLWMAEGYPLSDPKKAEITFEHVFQHTSGLMPEITADGTRVERGRYLWSDYGSWVVGHDPKYTVTGKLFFDPGKPEQYEGSEIWGEHRGAYSSIAFAHLGIAFHYISGQLPDTLLWQNLLKPIGFDGISYHYPPGGDYYRWFTAGGLRMTARDYARFCYLLLKRGRWQKKHLVDEEWVDRVYDTPNYPNLRSNIDHYLSDKFPEDMLRIYGSGGNFAYIIPSLDLIALHCGRCNNLWAKKLEEGFLSRMLSVLGGNNKN